jgi:sigma-E factor negative regulatory protein RseC
MGEELGSVLAVQDGRASVRLPPSEGCSSCGFCRSQGSDMFAELEAVPGLRVGDRVRVVRHPGGVLKAALLLYLAPAGALLCAAGAAEAAGAPPSGAWAGGLGGAAAAALFVRWADRRFGGRSEFQPRIVRVEAP